MSGRTRLGSSFQKFSEAHRNGKNELDDDLMPVKTDPIDADDIWISGQSTQLGQASNSSRLGCKGRRWAQLWRQHYGARLGIYNRKATESKKKEGKRQGTYSAAKCGVLAAAEYVVELSKQASQDGSLQQTPLGVSKSFLQSAVGDKQASPYNNQRLTRFQTLTTKKRILSQPFMKRNEELKKKRKDVKAAHVPIDLNSISAIAFLGERGQKLPFPIASDDAEVKERCGPDRSRRANLVVIDDLGRLFDCPDESSVNHVFAIVALGLPVITLSSWRLARGKVQMIPRESVTRHVSLATTTKFVFEYSPAFQSRYQLMLHTMKEIEKLPACEWIVRPLAKKKAVSVKEAARAENGFQKIN